MEVSFFLGKRSSSKLDIVAAEEVLADMGGLLGLVGILGVARDIDAS